MRSVTCSPHWRDWSLFHPTSLKLLDWLWWRVDQHPSLITGCAISNLAVWVSLPRGNEKLITGSRFLDWVLKWSSEGEFLKVKVWSFHVFEVDAKWDEASNLEKKLFFLRLFSEPNFEDLENRQFLPTYLVYLALVEILSSVLFPIAKRSMHNIQQNRCSVHGCQRRKILSEIPVATLKCFHHHWPAGITWTILCTFFSVAIHHDRLFSNSLHHWSGIE